MTLSKIKTMKNEGFTLVELLIVIVVIAILAAITIVAYNGVQNRAHTTAANSAASTVIKKAALYQTTYQDYPASLGDLTTADTTKDPAFSQGSPAFVPSSDVTSAAATLTAKPTGSDADKTVFYTTCSTGTPASVTGAKAVYWDFSGNVAKTLTTGVC